MKIVLDTNVLVSESKYQVWIDSDIEEFKKFSVHEDEYNKMEKGHKVILEYGEKSKFLYKFDSNCA